MIELIKNSVRENKIMYDVLSKIKILFLLLKIYFLKVFNFVRKTSCTKDSIRCEYDIKNKNYKYTLLGKDTPICCLTHLYEITRDTISILNKENIDYFIMYGTLLGQVRHNQSFIPWDTDVDIVVMQKDKSKVIDILNKKLANTYELVESKKILKVNFSKLNHLHADIYFWEEKDNILIDSLNDYWIKSRVKKNDIFPLTLDKLYDLDVKVPRNKEQILKDTYGEDCLDRAYKKYAFTNENTFEFNKSKICTIK